MFNKLLVKKKEEMFYKRLEIDSLLSCPKCLKRYDLPISLPCGYCICESCLEQATYTQTIFFNNDNQQKSNWCIDCPLCKEQHQVPEQNFPIQKSLVELLALNPSKEMHDIVFNEFKALLSEYTSKLDELKSRFEDSIEKINAHSKKMKNEITIRIETLVKLVKKYENDVVDRLKHFEHEKTNNLNDSIASIINNINLKLNDYNLLLNTENKNEKQKIKLATFDAIKFIDTLDINIIELNDAVDNAISITFMANKNDLKDSIVGELISSSIGSNTNDISDVTYEDPIPNTGNKSFDRISKYFESLVTQSLENIVKDDVMEVSTDAKKETSNNNNQSQDFIANESRVDCKTQ